MVDHFVRWGATKFYRRYVDDTLVLIKPHKNLKFLKKQISKLNKFMAWTGFPDKDRTAVLERLTVKYNVNAFPRKDEVLITENKSDEKILKVYHLKEYHILAKKVNT